MIFLLFVILLNAIYAQLIATSNSKDISLERIKTIYEKGFDKFLSYVITHYNSIEDENMTINNIDCIHYIKETNPYFYLKENIIVYSPSQFYLTFTFDFTLKEGTSSNGNFTMGIHSLDIKEQNNNNVFDVDISIDVSDSDFHILINSEDEETKKKVEHLIKSQFFDKNSETLENKFNAIIKEGIKEFYFDDIGNISIALSEQLGGYDLKITMNKFCGLCSDVKKTEETIQCFYMGSVTEKEYFDKQGDIEEYDDFFKEDGNYKMFVNYILINDTMNTNEVRSTIYDFNENTKPKDFEKLVLENIIYYFPNLYREVPRKASFYVKSHFDNFSLTGSRTASATMKHEFFFNDNKKSVIVLESIFMFDLNYTSFATNLNVCIENIILEKIKNVSPNSLLKLEHAYELLSLMRSIFKSYLINYKEFCLYKNNGIDFVEYFKLIEDFYIGNKGIFIKGKSMY